MAEQPAQVAVPGPRAASAPLPARAVSLHAEAPGPAAAALLSRGADWRTKQPRAVWLFLWISSAEPCRFTLAIS